MKIYVDKRSDLTRSKEIATREGHEVYRIRTRCKCAYPNNSRAGIIVINSDLVVSRIVRCRNCRKGGLI